ncbi:MAG: radical SAM protein [Planctomycetes bacterium]|nr:radical SAM protein [Planctomycetota bacterium]
MRGLALARDLARSNLPGAHRPFKLTLVLNYACNCRCAMCDIWKRPSRGEMTVEEIETFFRRESRWSWINLSGGEILMKKGAEEIIDIVTRSNQRLYLLDFPTTGFRPERLEGLARRALAGGPARVAISVSLDGPQEVHERIRQAPGLFAQAVESLRRLRSIGDDRLIVKAGMTLIPANVDHVDDLLDGLRRSVPGFAAEDLHLNLAQESEHYYDNAGSEALGGDAHRVRALETIARHRTRVRPRGAVGRLEDRFLGDLAAFAKDGRSVYSCRALRSSVFIDPFWNLFPCITWNRPLANLRELDFDLTAALATRDVSSTRDEIAARQCPDCWTACEAYQTILGHAGHAAWRTLTRKSTSSHGDRP